MGQGYVLSQACAGSEGATKVSFLASRREPSSGCDCAHAEPDGISAFQKKWFLQ